MSSVVGMEFLGADINVTEGSVITFCLNLMGAIDRPVLVNVSTLDIESATGKIENKH